MDIRKIKKLIELVEESGIAELEITEGEESVRIHRGGSQVAAAPMQFAAPVQAAAAPVAPLLQLRPRHQPSQVHLQPTGHVVRSPMVGTFYRSSSPGSAIR